jgi:hypothetical protein
MVIAQQKGNISICFGTLQASRSSVELEALRRSTTQNDKKEAMKILIKAIKCFIFKGATPFCWMPYVTMMLFQLHP